MSKQTHIVSVFISDNTWKKLSKIIEQLNATPGSNLEPEGKSSILRRALLDYIAAWEDQHGKLEEE